MEIGLGVVAREPATVDEGPAAAEAGVDGDGALKGVGEQHRAEARALDALVVGLATAGDEQRAPQERREARALSECKPTTRRAGAAFASAFPDGGHALAAAGQMASP